jgi:hypothetical protein
LGVSIGLALAIYGAVSIALGLGRPEARARRWCAAWLCPEEFSDRRTSELIRAGAVAELQRALVFDSASAYRWANLGEGYFNAGNPQLGRYAFLHAVAAGPRNPAILMRAANFAFSVGDFRKTMQYGSAILRDPMLADYYAPIFLTYARAEAPIAEILALGIPPERAPAQAFLRFLMAGNTQGARTGDAAAAWKWIAERGFHDDVLTGEYVAFLLRNREAEGAAETWAGVNASGMRDYRRTNWIYNGSFEAAPKPSPLDWRIEGAHNVEAKRIASEAHDGRWALELAFDGEDNVEYHGVAQQTVLTKGRWHAEAFIRTDGVTTDKGVVLRIYNLAAPQNLDARSQGLTGTQDWTKVDQTFDVREDMVVVQVEVMREASLKFDRKIAGRAWIDSVTIRKDRQPFAHARDSVKGVEITR